MASRRKRAPAPGDRKSFKVRLPQDIYNRVAGRAEKTGQTMTRVIINELGQTPYYETLGTFADQVEEMRIINAKQGARIEWTELSEDLLAALDVALNAQGTAQQAALDKVRVLRSAMLKTGVKA